jgi:hypothetical protein
MPVGEMLRRISSRELSEWMAFYQLGANQPIANEVIETPDELSKKLKSALFKGN